MFIVVRDQSKQLKHLIIGKDDELIRRYASADYIEHLLRKQETSGYDNNLEAKEALFAASDAN